VVTTVYRKKKFMAGENHGSLRGTVLGWRRKEEMI